MSANCKLIHKTKEKVEMSKYTLKIGGKYAGQFDTLKECREHAKNNGGYRYGWSVWDNSRQCEVLNKGESALHYTTRMHDEFSDGMAIGARVIFVVALVIAALAFLGGK